MNCTQKANASQCSSHNSSVTQANHRTLKTAYATALWTNYSFQMVFKESFKYGSLQKITGVTKQGILGQGRGEEKDGFNKQLLHILVPLIFRRHLLNFS